MSALPYLYQEVEPLDREKHADLKLLPATEGAFCKQSSILPVLLEEFILAQNDYPIVFSVDPIPQPVLMLGFKPEQNLFVDEHGNWAKDMYVPAYVRRYPFIVGTFTTEQGPSQILCLDPKSTRLARGEEGTAVLNKGELSDLSKQVFELSMAYEQGAQANQAFCEALVKHDLFIEQGVIIKGPAAVKLGGQEEFQSPVLKVINESKLANLSGDVLKAWIENGYLRAIYAHLNSLRNVDRVTARVML